MGHGAGPGNCGSFLTVPKLMEDGFLPLLPVPSEHLLHTDPALDLGDHTSGAQTQVTPEERDAQIPGPFPPVWGSMLGDKNIRTSSCRGLAEQEGAGGATAALG